MNIFSIILTCEKYKNKMLMQNLSELPGDYRYFIGNSDLEYPKEIGKIVYLPCGDHYEDLTQKTLLAIKWVCENMVDFDFILKTDDDIKIKNGILNLIKENKHCDYFGEVVRGGYYSSWHFGKCFKEAEQRVYVPDIEYCKGAAYFLSKEAALLLSQNFYDKEHLSIFEDVSVGNILYSNKIYPQPVNIRKYFIWDMI